MNKKIGLIMLLSITLTGCHMLPAKKPNLTTNHSPIILEQQISDNIIIPVVINKKKYNFLLDTGASITVIDESLAKKITHPLSRNQISANYQREFSSIQAVSGKISGDRLTFLKPLPFSIGHQEITDSDLWIAQDLSLVGQSIGRKIEGIIGIDTFRKFNWLIDNKNKTLFISHTAPSAIEYRTCTGYEDHYNGKPQLWFTYRGQHSVGFMVDTGASTSYIASSFIDYIKKNGDPIKQLSYGQTGGDAIGLTVNDGYIIQGFAFENAPLGKMRFTENSQGLFALGMDFFSRFERYAFIPSRMMFCYDGQNIKKDRIAHERNIAIRAFNNQIEIFYNNNKLIDQYGLKNGDRIIKMNGKKYLPYEINLIRNALLETPKGQLKMTIGRQQDTFDLLI